ncbi:hypothetical protein ACH470_00515 [Streptomyces bottropensis]|uniref:hypothetical protein n=1 Tax=Streptomyces bottropensis TaxID=42235 RepID=UPI0037B096D3
MYVKSMRPLQKPLLIAPTNATCRRGEGKCSCGGQSRGEACDVLLHDERRPLAGDLSRVDSLRCVIDDERLTARAFIAARFAPP